MGATEPRQLHELFGKFFNAKDTDGILSLYEPDAVLIAAPGSEPARGPEQIRAALDQFLAMDVKIEFGDAAVIAESGDIALTHGSWKLVTSDGQSAGEGRTAEVSRRGADGTWRYVVDNPWGTAALDG
jgi:uncharacterized protein (TIGR02246 family)